MPAASAVPQANSLGCLGLLDQSRDLASRGSDAQQGPHHQVETHRRIGGLHLGHARLTGPQSLGERRLGEPSALAQLAYTCGERKLQFDKTLFLRAEFQELGRVSNDPSRPFQARLLVALQRFSFALATFR